MEIHMYGPEGVGKPVHLYNLILRDMKISEKDLRNFLSNVRKSLDNLCEIIEKEFSLVDYSFHVENSNHNFNNRNDGVFCSIILGDWPNKNCTLENFRECYNEHFKEALKKYNGSGINVDMHITGWKDRVKKYMGNVKIAEPKNEVDELLIKELRKMCEKPEQD